MKVNAKLWVLAICVLGAFGRYNRDISDFLY
jgi:hypothetical protein